MKKRLIPIIFLSCFVSCLLFSQPVSHDPSNIVKEGERYWAFHTGVGVHATSATSVSFTNWRNEGSVLKTSPEWAKQYAPEFDGHCWAPDIIYMNGKWHLYYSCSSWGSNESAIGLTTTTSLASKTWEDQGMVTYTTRSSNTNAIDPDVFRDKNGNYWMTYGSYWGGVVITALDSLTGKPQKLNDITYLANNGCEAPAIICKDNLYYLFFNRGACCDGIMSTYQMFVGRATRPTGPYRDKNGVDCNAGGGSPFLHTDGRFIGPGHFGLYGEDVLSYHFYDGHNNGVQKMKIAKLKWEKGWPVAEYEREGKIDDGTYKLKNRNSGNYMITQNAATGEETHLVLGSEKNDATDQWVVRSESDLSYKILLQPNNAQAVGIPNCTGKEGDPIGIRTESSELPCQNWYFAEIKESSDKYYILYNIHSNLVVEVQNAYTAEDSKIQQWSSNGHYCQQWAFEPVMLTGIDNVPASSESILVSVKENNRITITSNDERFMNSQIKIHNITGGIIYQGILKDKTTTVSLPETISAQIIFISIIEPNGNITVIKAMR